jgi:hypothetical protein
VLLVTITTPLLNPSFSFTLDTAGIFAINAIDCYLRGADFDLRILYGFFPQSNLVKEAKHI